LEFSPNYATKQVFRTYDQYLPKTVICVNFIGIFKARKMMLSTDEMLQGSSFDDGLVACIKDNNAKVLYQNDACLLLCGDQLGKECHSGCMDIYGNDSALQWKNRGSKTYNNCHIHGQYFDMTVISKYCPLMSQLFYCFLQ